MAEPDSDKPEQAAKVEAAAPSPVRARHPKLWPALLVLFIGVSAAVGMFLYFAPNPAEAPAPVAAPSSDTVPAWKQKIADVAEQNAERVEALTKENALAASGIDVAFVLAPTTVISEENRDRAHEILNDYEKLLRAMPEKNSALLEAYRKEVIAVEIPDDERAAFHAHFERNYAVIKSTLDTFWREWLDTRLQSTAHTRSILNVFEGAGSVSLSEDGYFEFTNLEDKGKYDLLTQQTAAIIERENLLADRQAKMLDLLAHGMKQAVR